MQMFGSQLNKIQYKLEIQPYKSSKSQNQGLTPNPDSARNHNPYVIKPSPIPNFVRNYNSG